MEAPAIRCQSCGAPVPEDASQCPYCQSQLATVACPRCFGMVFVHARHCCHCGAEVVVRQQEADSGLECAECRIPLAITPLGGVDIHQCCKCGGVWLEHERFANLAAAHEEHGKAMAATGARPAAPAIRTQSAQYRPCPACKQLMNRFNFGRASGVILDSCKAHGLWFDRDELKRVMTFIDGGGLVRAQLAETEQQKEATRALAVARMTQESPAASGWGGTQEGLTVAPVDLVDTVRRFWHLVQVLKD